MFADSAQIEVTAGKGGDGALSFRHEKYRAMGGADGGDGGHGANVVFVADHNISSLADFRTQKRIQGEDGQAGSGNRRHGKSGVDVEIKLPIGTVVYNEDEVVVDLVENGQRVVIAKGGRGGFGNAHFVSSVRQAPRAAEFGEKGEGKLLRLELKLVADIGLVGLPNAGKSTLLSVISNAKPQIGDYAFTTLVPNLGVVDIDGDSVLMADIPGLIEGASQGKGLGDEFLRHIERTAVLLHLIDVTSPTLAEDYRVILEELRSYEVDLSQKPRLIVPTKTEAVPEDLLADLLKEVQEVAGKDAILYPVSAQAHRGLDSMLRAALPLVQAARAERAAVIEEEAVVVIDETSQPDMWFVVEEGEGWRITGERVEGFARRTDWDNDDAVDRMRDILRKTGVAREIRRQGAKPGEMLFIGEHQMEWLG